MRIPAVAIAAGFACGIVLGQSRAFAGHAATHSYLVALIVSIAVLLCAGLVLTWRDFLWVGAGTSLLCSVGLGVLASSLAQQPLPPEHILSRLVVAGLHVGALAVFLYWLARKLRLSRYAEVALILVFLCLYVMMVEQRTPVLRAALTTAITLLLSSIFYRRLDLLNTAALAGSSSAGRVLCGTACRWISCGLSIRRTRRSSRLQRTMIHWWCDCPMGSGRFSYRETPKSKWNTRCWRAVR